MAPNVKCHRQNNSNSYQNILITQHISLQLAYTSLAVPRAD